MKTNMKIAAAVLAAAALGLAGCGGGSTAESTPEATGAASPTAATVEFKACQVTDTGGVDDKSFNQTAWKGVQDAQAQLGIEAAVLESQAETDYMTNIQSFIDQGCDIIITVGFLLGDATMEAANANPDQKFSIVDYAYADGDIVNNNVVGQVFNTDEAAYLAGYLAAGMTKTGKVGTFGGLNIPTVTIFMDGYARGVAAYNAANGTDVQVLGWDPATQEGLFTENFESLDDGRKFAQNLVDEGADIVMPVAGPVGLGSAALATELGVDKLAVIGVDSDASQTDSANSGVYLTSVMKLMDVTTFNVIQSAMDGTFVGGVTVGDLANGGVGLAPFGASFSIPAELVTQIDELKAGIIDGSVDVKK